jgi:predicted DNA-binding antitoxin AbrB/MazE fold protein
MKTITVQAVYRKGALRPKKKLDLPENTLVQVQVTPLKAAPVPAGSLFGAFPELKAITEEDISWIKRLWEHGLEKQMRILDGLE